MGMVICCKEGSTIENANKRQSGDSQSASWDIDFLNIGEKMARWTETLADQERMTRIAAQIPVGGITRIVLNDGTVIEGVL